MPQELPSGSADLALCICSAPEVRTMYITWHTVGNPTKFAGKEILFKIFHLTEHHLILLKDDLQTCVFCNSW